MADSPGAAARLASLRRRWEQDRSSRIFLQLAEEYRHLGHLPEAMEVLEAGLQRNPAYPAARVALGRCRLELGNFAGAITLLEEVLTRDPTQMVASKLLVLAALGEGRAEAARQWLEHYSLLNSSDPDIADLKVRIATLRRPGEAVPPEVAKTPATVTDEVPEEEPAEVRPRADSAPPPEPPAAVAPVPPQSPMPPAEPDSPAARPAPAVRASSQLASPATLFALDVQARPPVPDLAAVPPPRGGERGGRRTRLDLPEPFPGLGNGHRRSRYAAAWSNGEIFSFVPLAPPEPPAPEPQLPVERPRRVAASPPPPPSPGIEASAPPILAEAMAVEALEWTIIEPPVVEPRPAPAITATPTAVAPPAAASAAAPPAVADDDFGDITQPRFEPAAPAPPPEVAAPEPPSPPAELASPMVSAPPPPPTPRAPEPESTITLGELYLSQGHLPEAETIFREVLAHDPAHPGALTGLRAVEAQRAGPLSAAGLLTGYSEDLGEGLTARKTYLLRSYLGRLRRAQPADTDSDVS